MALLSTIIDDDEKSAKDLWDALERLYIASNDQAVLNLMHELERLEYQEGKSWEEHLNKFHEILNKLAALDKAIPDDDKSSKLIRTLPEHFALIAMVSSHMTYEDLVNAVETEISRRKLRQRDKSTVQVPKASTAAVNGNGQSSVQDGRISKNTKKEGDGCYICGRHNHKVKDCWYRYDRLAKRGMPPYRGRGRGRGGRGRGSHRGGRGRGVPFQQRPFWDNSSPPMHYSQQNSQANWGSQQQLRDQGSSSQQHAHAAQQNHQAPGNYPTNTEWHGYQHPSFDRQYGFMAAIKYRSTVASIGFDKKNTVLIDSGASNHFFHSKKSFQNYKQIRPLDVQAASEVSIIVGKGEIFLESLGRIRVEAFHTPHFQTNILSVGLLTDNFNLSFTKVKEETVKHSMCIISDRISNNVVKEVRIDNDGLYRIPIQAKRPGQHSMHMEPHEESFRCYLCKGAFPTKIKSQKDLALEWHSRTGHPSPARYAKLSSHVEDVETFPRHVMEDLLCIPCAIAKAQRRPILPSTRMTTLPLELVHVDITGKMSKSSLGGCHYAVGFVDDFSAKTDVYFIRKRSELYPALQHYKERSEKLKGCSVLNIRLDGAGENMSNEVTNFALMNGIRLEASPPHAPQSNGVAERFMRELGTRSRVLLFGAKLEDKLWAEAMHHSNWLRNRLPSERVNGNIPIMIWNPNATVSFRNVPVFGEHGFAFLYQSETRPQKKLSARALHGQFVGLESEKTLFRVFIPQTQKVIITRAQDFRRCATTALPGVSALIDGISRQSELESSQSEANGFAEEILSQAFQSSLHLTTIPHANIAKHNLKDPRLPRSFREAIKSAQWRDAINREYSALKRRGTWEYIPISTAARPLPVTWVFRIKTAGPNGEVLHKARCCVRGDLQSPGLDFDPNQTYAPVASHHALRMLLSLAAAEDLIIEGGDVCNAYLYGDIDMEIIIEQPMDSSGLPEKPGFACRLRKSMYGIRQAGNIWGSLLETTIISWNFTKSTADSRVLLKRDWSGFIIVLIVVDDMAFVSNSKRMLEDFKSKLCAAFDVKFFNELRAFIGWEIRKEHDGIRVTQTQYTTQLLAKHGLKQTNGAWTPLPSNPDVSPKRADEEQLPPSQHAQYRSTIGELLYLAVCTRPDISFAVGALSRQVHAPTNRHANLTKRILRYLAGTKSYGIKYLKNSVEFMPVPLKAFSDSDWAGDQETRKSTSGFVILLHGKPIAWKSVRQTIVALSSAEAEYIALATCGKELEWIQRLLSEILLKMHGNVRPTSTVPVFVDNTAAIAIASTDQINARTKHIAVKFHYVRDLIKRNVLIVNHIGTKDQLADILTKSVGLDVLRRYRERLLM